MNKTTFKISELKITWVQIYYGYNALSTSSIKICISTF